MSDTPRVDAFCNQWPDEIEPIMLPAIMQEALTLMTSMERELAKAINQRDVLRVAINNIKKATSTCGCCGSIEMATKIDKIINNIEETK